MGRVSDTYEAGEDVSGGSGMETYSASGASGDISEGSEY